MLESALHVCVKYILFFVDKEKVVFECFKIELTPRIITINSKYKYHCIYSYSYNDKGICVQKQFENRT